MYYKLKKTLLRVSLYYQADLRALSLLRIGIALVILADLYIRARDLSAHYTDAGLWPTGLIRNFGWQQGFWSLHSLYGNYEWVFFLFCLHAIAAVFLLFGYKTKLATIITWLLTISLHNRNLFVLQSGDDLLRLVLLWGFFLPWNNHYALDAGPNKKSPTQFNFAYLGYLFLLASVYCFSACLKSGTEWRVDGTAIYYALSLEQLRLPGLGDWLYQFPGAMKGLTHFIFYTQLSLPLLILWPSKKGYSRAVAFVLILILHSGIGLTLYVGLFFVISMVSAIGLLPAMMMNKFENLLKIKKQYYPYNKKQKAFRQGVINLFCISVIIFCLILNLSGLPWFKYELNSALRYPVNALRLNQYWGMFAPYVMKKDGWFVYYGLDSAGRQWDLRRNEDYVDFAKPDHIVSLYKSDRWRKLAENMQDDRFSFLRPLYCKHIVNRWNKNHPEKKIMTLNLYFMEKISLPAYQTTPVEKKLFCVCFND